MPAAQSSRAGAAGTASRCSDEPAGAGGVGGGARVILEHANHLSALGARVTVTSHFSRPEWFDFVADFVEVSFGHPLCQSVPACDVIVAGYWDEIVAGYWDEIVRRPAARDRPRGALRTGRLSPL